MKWPARCFVQNAGLIRARAWRILSETALLSIYLLLLAWNILNVRFV